MQKITRLNCCLTWKNDSLSGKVDGFADGDYAAVTGLAYDATNKKLGIKVGADAVIPFSSSIKAELLWENPNPKATYDSGTVIVDTSKYPYFIIEFSYGGNITAIASRVILSKNEKCAPGFGAGLNSSYSNCAISRNVTIGDNVISFSQSWYGTIKPSYDTMIPQRIYGVDITF